MARLRVLTLNIWHREAPWERRRELIREGILALDPDIIALQEVLQLRMGDVVQNQAAEIFRDTPYGFVYGAASSLGPGFEFGNAIASKFPIGEPLVVRLPGEETGEMRSVVHAVVSSPLGDVPMFCTHLNWKLHHGAVRLRQIDAILALMQEKFPIEAEFPPPAAETFPPILAGDFNAEPESDEIRFLRGFATRDGRSVFFADAWSYGGDGGPGFTFDRRNAFAARSHEPPRRIDYVFVRGPDSKWRGEPLKTQLVFTEPTDDVWASDHFGLLTELSTHAETRAWPA
jgi:endonuclease/exonuclease/phosphatase family metal-dependent hydrolase